MLARCVSDGCQTHTRCDSHVRRADDLLVRRSLTSAQPSAPGRPEMLHAPGFIISVAPHCEPCAVGVTALKRHGVEWLPEAKEHGVGLRLLDDFPTRSFMTNRTRRMYVLD
jgi:hypothetical protein